MELLERVSYSHYAHRGVDSARPLYRPGEVKYSLAAAADRSCHSESGCGVHEAGCGKSTHRCKTSSAVGVRTLWVQHSRVTCYCSNHERRGCRAPEWRFVMLG